MIFHLKCGNRAVRVGAGYNNTIRNNTDGVFRNTLNPDDLPDWLKNHKGLVPRIVVPKYYREGSNGSGLTDDEGNGVAPWNTGSNPNGDTVFGSNRDTSILSMMPARSKLISLMR